jgi:SPP1 family predicted phage head-tail adaptor
MPFGRPVLSGRPMVASGQRTRAVTIQQLTESTGESGFPIETWTTLAVEYMARLDLRANEQFAVNQTSAFAETQWHMPYREDMDPDLVDVAKTRRLVYEGRTYDILTASALDWRKGIELTTLAKQG